MSANLIVDIGGAAQLANTIGVGSGNTFAASGATIGQSIDLINANTYCNLVAMGNYTFGSGQLRIAVQTADADTSGLYTDPTSGMPVFPAPFQSGGLIILNSGGVGNGLFGTFVSGQSALSGFAVAAAFQRPQRFARANVLSGDFYAGNLTVGFISQLKTTGSGGGFTYAPTSGVVNV